MGGAPFWMVLALCERTPDAEDDCSSDRGKDLVVRRGLGRLLACLEDGAGDDAMKVSVKLENMMTARQRLQQSSEQARHLEWKCKTDRTCGAEEWKLPTKDLVHEALNRVLKPYRGGQ